MESISQGLSKYWNGVFLGIINVEEGSSGLLEMAGQSF
jgi:hypothetical protein